MTAQVSGPPSFSRAARCAADGARIPKESPRTDGPSGLTASVSAAAPVSEPLTADFIEALGVGTFEPEGVELELIAHGDGAFYSRHIDTFTGEASNANAGRQRLVSAVFYAYRQPKGFSGGALRLYSLRRDDTLDDFIDIAPMHNCLVVFPSWVPHSVELVSCPSGNFADSRFAVNAWLWRNKPAVSRLAKPI